MEDISSLHQSDPEVLPAARCLPRRHLGRRRQEKTGEQHTNQLFDKFLEEECITTHCSQLVEDSTCPARNSFSLSRITKLSWIGQNPAARFSFRAGWDLLNYCLGHWNTLHRLDEMSLFSQFFNPSLVAAWILRSLFRILISKPKLIDGSLVSQP